MIKSISGLRGEVGGSAGDGLTPLDIVKFTSAYAAWVRSENPDARHIVVGRDARLSGEMVRQIVCGTLMGMGFDVTDIGLATTPTTKLSDTFKSTETPFILIVNVRSISFSISMSD
jgi:phosphomannomutase